MARHCGRQLPARECLLRRIYADTHGTPAACAGCERGGAMFAETPRRAPRRGPGRPRKSRPVDHAAVAAETFATLATLASPIPVEAVTPLPVDLEALPADLRPVLAEGVKAAMETPAAYPEAEEFVDGLVPVPAAEPASAGAYPEAGEAIDGLAQDAPSAPSPEAAAAAWLDQAADPAAPGAGQEAYLLGMLAAEPREPQPQEHEDGQGDAPSGAMQGMPGGVDHGHGAPDGANGHETAAPGQPGVVPGLREADASGQPEQQPAPETLAEAGEGQVSGETEAAPGRSSSGGVGETAPAPENPARAILAGVVAGLCASGLRRTSLKFLQSEFNAASPADLAVRSPEAMADLAATAGLRQADHRGAPGVILEVRP